MKRTYRYIAWILAAIMLVTASACSDKSDTVASQNSDQVLSQDETREEPGEEAEEPSDKEDEEPSDEEGDQEDDEDSSEISSKESSGVSSKISSKNSSKKGSSKKSSFKKSSSKKSSSKKSSSKNSSSKKSSSKKSSVKSDSSTNKPSSPQTSGPSGVEITPDVNLEKLWGGKAAEKVALGGGTEEYPFIIQTPSELAFAISSGGGGHYYRLANDIYLNDVSDPDWANNKNNNAWYNTEFEGHIDGAGHCVYGVWYPDSKRPKYGGLVAQFAGGSIKNLGVRYARIYAQAYAGGIVGIANTTDRKTIEGCFVDETVAVAYTVDSTNGAGGILGYASGGGGTFEKPTLVIKNCYSKAKLSGYDEDYRLNGIIGTSWDCGYIMENCYSVGYPAYRGNSKRAASTLIDSGADPEKVYKNIYNDAREAKNFEVATLLKKSEMIGKDAKSSMDGFDFGDIWETVTEGTPKLKVFEDIEGKNIKTPDAQSIAVINKLFESGSGAKDDPFIISNAAQFRNMLDGSKENKYYKLSCDIHINNVSKKNWINQNPDSWVSNNTFKGNFDGDGHSVYGVYMNQIPSEGDIISDATGLFPKVSTTAVIRNVNLKNSYIHGKGYVGGIVGLVLGNSTAEKYAKIVGCTVDKTVKLAGQTVGGIVGGGVGGAEISYCAFTGEISEFTGGSNRGNGIVGDIWSKNYKIADSYSVGYTTYRGSYTPKDISAVYATEPQKGVIHLEDGDILGSEAKTKMPELNWDVWKVEANGYPVPRVVKESNDYKF